ncbi:MAG TPA: hypothetical protein VIE38_03600 [Gaiellaceae bacterium]
MSRKPAFTAAVLVAASLAAGAHASSPPIGALPAGPHATITTKAGELVAVALPHRSGGRVWRIARAFDGRLVTEVSEADVGPSVVLVFKAKHAGNVTLSFALTRGETTKALEARTFEVRIR